MAPPVPYSVAVRHTRDTATISDHVIQCFSLTPTAIVYKKPNVSATMQQPSSVVHNKLQDTQPLNTQRKHRKK